MRCPSTMIFLRPAPRLLLQEPELNIDISGKSQDRPVRGLRVSQIGRERENNATITCKMLVRADVGLCLLCRVRPRKKNLSELTS